MRLVRALLCALCLLAATEAHATWSVAQTVKTSVCGGTNSNCVTTITATTAGNVLVVAMTMSTLNDPITTITDNGTPGSSYTVPSGCAAFEPTSSLLISCGYTLNVTGGVTSVTVNRATTTSAVWAMKIMEFHSTTTEIFDTVGTLVTSTSTTSPLGPALTLSGTNDLVVQIMRGSTPTAVSAAYTFASGANNGGYAYILNSSTAPAPTWTQSSGKSATSGIAIKEAGGVQPVVDIITRNYFPSQ